MRIGILGGWDVEHDGHPVEVSGAMQRALLFRLALDPGAHLGYRAIAEDVWPDDPPENAKAALQSLVSRLRTQLPDAAVTSTPGGYRLEVARDDVDAVRFQDLVARASGVASSDPAAASALADEALALWAGEPWTPGDGYDWFERALADDRRTALALGGSAASAVSALDVEPIPAPLTGLIGRETELAQLSEQLDHSRLVTILGPGGAGKTRLAIEVARGYRHAVLVELAPAGPDELWQSVLGALGREVRIADASASTATVQERIIAALRGTQTLLVLDNCEHLIEAAADAAHELLAALPRLTILTTSREPLSLPGEAFVPLGPLTPVAASRLFAERVLAARGTAPLPDEEQAAARIRKRLDGLPLALELAAAKARTMTIDEIADGLDDRFGLLSGGLRTVLPRHQTLRALVDWSWSLLDDGEQRMLGSVSIYPAGIAATDAAGVAAAHGGTRAQLDALVDKSLLQRAVGRYRALETIREYGLEKLADAGQLPEARTAQARWLADAVRREDARLRGPAIHEAIEWFDAEDDNLVSALRFTVDSELGELVVALLAGSAWYWVIRDRNEDAFQWLSAGGRFAAELTGEDALFVRAVTLIVEAFDGFVGEASPDALAEFAAIRRESAGTDNELLQVIPLLLEAFSAAFEQQNWMLAVRFPDDANLDHLTPWGRAMIATMRAALAQNRGDIEVLGESSALATELFADVGDLWGIAIAKQMRAEWLALAGRYEEALQASDESTEAMRHITSTWDLQQQQGLAVNMLMRLGRIDEAIARAEQLLAEAEESGSSRASALATSTRGLLALQLGDLDTARAMFDRRDSALSEWPEIPAQLEALSSLGRGWLAMLDGDSVGAERELRHAAETAAASHDHPVMAAIAVGIGRYAIERGYPEDAEQALELAVSLRGVADPDDPLEQSLRNAIEAARPAHVESGRTASGDAAGRDSEIAELTQILRR